MGLDMYLYSCTALRDSDEYTGAVVPVGEYDEVAYWRKHPDLHGWMENLYRERGGVGTFNCIDIELTEDDLVRLIDDIAECALPETSGFFFGKSYCTQEERDNDTKIFYDALTCVRSGDKIIYSSWW